MSNYKIFLIILLLIVVSFFPLPLPFAKKIAQNEMAKLVKGEWKLESVSFSIFNGLLVSNIHGVIPLPNSYDGNINIPQASIILDKFALLRGRILPTAVAVKSPTINMIIKQKRFSVQSFVSGTSMLASGVLVPLEKLTVRNCRIVCKSSGLLEDMDLLIGDITIEQDKKFKLSANFNEAMLSMGGTEYCHELSGTAEGDIHNTITFELSGKALSGSISANGTVVNGVVANLVADITGASMGLLRIQEGKLSGKVSVKLNMNMLNSRAKLGEAYLKFSGVTMEGFPFQKLPHIDWLMPAVKKLSFKSAAGELSLMDSHLIISNMVATGTDIRLTFSGRADYHGNIMGKSRLAVASNGIVNIPYLTSRALPKNSNNEYEIPVTVSGKFPNLDVKPEVAFVTRAVGGVLKDAVQFFRPK